MAKTTTTPILQTIKNGLITIVNADASTLKTLYTAGSEGSVIRSILISSDDTANRIVQFWVYNGSTSYLVGAIQAPTLAGTNGVVKAMDALANTGVMLGYQPQPDARRTIELQAGYILKCSSTSTVTSGKTITITASGRDY